MKIWKRLKQVIMISFSLSKFSIGPKSIKKNLKIKYNKN